MSITGHSYSKLMMPASGREIVRPRVMTIDNLRQRGVCDAAET